MSLFQQLDGKAQQQRNPMQLLQQLQKDPTGMLKQAGFDVPGGMTDPRQMVQHLLNSGQINQNRVNMAQQMAQRFRR